MNCELVINISRFNLQVFYSQNKNSYKTFKYGSSENIPFYVFSDGNDFEIGDSAKIKCQNHLENSFFDYFNLIKDKNSTFLFLDGEEKKMSFLLTFTIDKIIKELFKFLLIGDDLSEIRDSVKLNLVFSSDISDVEINFLVDIFENFGYKKCKFLSSSYIILNYLDNNRKIGAFKDSNSNMGSFKGYVVIDAIDNNLQIDFFDSLNKKYPKLHEEGKDLANDPKVLIIAKEMYQQAADATDSLTLLETELPQLIPLAQKYATTDKAEFRVEVVLTDGKSKKVKIKMRSINDKVSYLSNFTKDFDLVKSLVKKSNLGNTDIAFVIKQSVVSQNFLDKLKSNYNNFYFSDSEFVDIVELFISSEEVINQGDFAFKITNTEQLVDNSKQIVVKPTSSLESKPSVPSSIPQSHPKDPPSVNPIPKTKIKSGNVPKKSPPPPPPPPSPKAKMVNKPLTKNNKVNSPPPPPSPKAKMVNKPLTKNNKVNPPPPPPPSNFKNVSQNIRDIKNSPKKTLQPQKPKVAENPPSMPVIKKNKVRLPPPIPKKPGSRK